MEPHEAPIRHVERAQGHALIIPDWLSYSRGTADRISLRHGRRAVRQHGRAHRGVAALFARPPHRDRDPGLPREHDGHADARRARLLLQAPGRARRFFRVTRDLLVNPWGRPTRSVLPYSFPRAVGRAAARRCDELKEKLYRDLYGPKRRATPGVRRFLAAARADGARVGLGTGSKGDNVAFILDGLNLRAFFDAVVDSSQVAKGKPDPETFLTLAEKLKTRPRDCVVFEDSLLGEEAARRAGMKVVAITTSHRADEFRGAALALPDFRELATATVRALATGGGRFARIRP
ncbi:MAG: HAD family hydrolase [Elusimicrobiota bacterium]